DGDVVYVLQDAHSLLQARDLVPGQVDLRHVAGDDHAGAEAYSRQEHLHLLARGVLRLVEDDEAVVQRAAAHIGQGRDFDVAALKVLDRKSTRLNSSHVSISYAVFCLKKKIKTTCINSNNAPITT